MKLCTVCLFFIIPMLLFASARASAAPWRAPADEDALVDGDLDVEDIATRGPLARLSATKGTTAVLRAPSGSASLSLVGFTRKTLDDLREVGGFVVLALPLDRFTRANTRVTSAPVLEDPAAFATTPQLVPASAPASLGLTPAAALDAPFELALTPRLARSCVTAAWRAAGLGVDDARLDAIVSRARWSAALPEARLRAVRFDDARLSLDTDTDTNRLRDSSGANIGFEARLTWRFDRLIYADDEPSFERIRLEHRDARARIAAKVLEGLFHWQRAALDLRTLPPSQQGTRDEADVILRVMEAEAALDVLTNGWFAAQRSQKPRAMPVQRGSAAGEL
jgi:hypothetical protein